MNQSTFTVVVILAAFVVYTTLKGNLRGYLNILGLN